MSRLARIVRWLVNLLVVLFIGTIFVLAGFRIAAARREVLSRSEAAPSTGQFIHAADVQMFVQEDGPSDGPPVVLIHGTGAWSEIWRGTMHALAGAGYRAIALDMPPFGFSTRPTSADYSDSAQARRILVTLDSLGCLCSTMFRVSPNHLLWVLDGLIDGEVHNHIVVPEPTKTWAKVALDRMLTLT